LDLAPKEMNQKIAARRISFCESLDDGHFSGTKNHNSLIEPGEYNIPYIKGFAALSARILCIRLTRGWKRLLRIVRAWSPSLIAFSPFQRAAI
jgi:hypothetical protein